MHSFSGVKLVPPSMVPIVRSALAAQGVDPYALTDAGELDPMGILSLGFDKMEVRTAFSPPIVVSLKGPMPPDVQAAGQRIKPTVIFSGRVGRVEIAPFGPASGITPEVKRAGISIGLGVGAAILGVLLFGGAIFRR